ncbi:MAG: hypothetical protein ABIO70_27585 [Pseudomonadota bacterium]
MEPPLPTTCWLEAEDGRQHPVGPRGLLIGRAPASELLLTHPAASRRAALAWLEPEGPRIVRLGGGPVHLDGVALEGCQPLRDGQRLSFPGCDLRVRVEASAPIEASRWVLRHRGLGPDGRPRLEFLPLPAQAVTVGGAEGEDLQVPGWPTGALRLTPGPGPGWSAEVGQDLKLNGRFPPLEGNAFLRTGDEISFGGEQLRLVDMAAGQQSTVGDDHPELPWKIGLQPVPPAGGRLEVHQGHRVRSTWIPGLRFDLLLVLLQPQGRLRPGEPVPDDEALSRLWGRQLPRDPKAVNTLVKRLRADLDQAGLDGRELVERAHNRTRFVLAKGAQVTVDNPR